MRILIIPVLVVGAAFSFGSCKSSSGPQTFCDTACLKDTLKFTGDHKLQPYVYISAKDCQPDTITWSYNGMGTNRKTGFEYTSAKINKDYIRCFFNDTASAWILFNDCATGRGYQIKLPYNKNQSFSMRTSGINDIDPKFSIAKNLVVNTDRGNIYVEDMTSGKKAMMTFGEKLDIDYDVIHDHIDSVNITNERIWVKVKVGKDWKELQKKIVLE